jgi:hypothetical protein
VVNQTRLGGHELVAIHDPESGRQQDRKDRVRTGDCQCQVAATPNVADRGEDRLDRLDAWADNQPIEGACRATLAVSGAGDRDRPA